MSSASGSRPADGALPIRTKEQKQPTKPAAANVAPKPNTSENTDASINSLVSAAEEQVAKSRPGYKTHRRRERKKRLKALFRDEEGKKPQEMPPQDESMAKSRRTKPRAEKKSGDDQAEKAAAGDDKAVAARGSRAAKPQAEKTGGGFIIEKRHGAPSWKLSPFLGGRYAPLDPVFTKDEKHLLVAQALSLKVYSVKTSLLVRAISLPATAPTEHIISYFLDSRTDDRVYVASNSWLYLYNLTNGERVHGWRLDENEKVRHVCACADQELKPSESEAVYLVTKSGGDSLLWRVGLSENQVVEKTQIFRVTGNITAVHSADAGRAVCLITAKDLVVINFDGTKWQAPRVFKMAELLTCMDVLKVGSGNTKKSKKGTGQRGGDIVVGDSSGAMYVLHGVVTSRAEVTPRKMHWHRMAVQSVKWALDGTYIISGGLETVLVLWQVETAHKQFLPHLGAEIKNIVVSPRGALYALSLSDNSVMVLSTSEFKAKANIAGIQSHAQLHPTRQARSVPCLLHPTKANSLLIATPSNQLDQAASSPYLQTFDTYSDRHVSRQALARTNATIVNQDPNKTLIAEPNISFLAVTSDGQWLASVDEWMPKSSSGKAGLDGQVPSRKREVHLKFWRWSEARKEWELITRVDSPHPSSEELGSERVLDLIAAPNGQAFVTIGSDGSAKLWKPKLRVRPGSTESSVNWTHRRAISFSKQFPESWGYAAFSDDSSLLAVSCPAYPGFGTHEDSQLHLIDPAAGTIRQSLGGLHIGRTYGLAVVDRYLVVAGANKLLLWNLVHARAEWEYITRDLGADPATLHLAVDHRDISIAVTFSPKYGGKNDSGAKILVWSPAANPDPALVARLEAPIAALKSAGPGKGFVLLDAHARVQYINPALAAHASVASILESGQEVEEEEEAAAVGVLSGMYRSEDRMEIDEDDEEEEGVTEKVVARERLEEVFDGFETYEQGAVEAAFERIVELFAKKPLGEEDEEEEESEEEEEEEESEDDD